jgi:integrase
MHEPGYSPSGCKRIETKTPGVYRRGGAYVVVFRDASGRQRKRAAKTLAEARDLRAMVVADVARGEYRELSRVTFAQYAPQWIATYQGRTARGFREETRGEYRRDLGLDDDGTPLVDKEGKPRGAVAFFGRMRLSAIEPRDVKRYAAELSATGLSPASVKLALAPVKAMFNDAVEEGLLRSNPAAGLRVAPRAAVVGEDDPEGKVKALTRDELRRLLKEVPDDHRLLVELIAHTGVRISEAVALQWRDVDFEQRRLHVRRRLYRGDVAAPKSRAGRRSIRLSRGMSENLWELRRTARPPGETTPIFPSRAGTPFNPSNLFNNVLKPAARGAGVPWAGFHTLRHTAATLRFQAGWNVKQVQQLLGHHKASFTLDTYIHHLPDDEPEPDFLDSITAALSVAAMAGVAATAAAAK